jgi:subtilisin family serine protease
LEGAIRAIDYGSKMGARIMNASWAGSEPSELLKEAIARAEKAGVLFVTAAGNNGSNNDKVPSYPASYDLANILTVAAVTSRGELAKFSNYGRKSVDVAAPGVGIMSTTPQGYKFFSGTSMATPHVTGIAALLLSQFPRMTYAEMKERIIRTAKPLDVLRKKIVSGGVANAYFALADVVPPPAPMDPRGWATVASVISSEHPYREKSEKVFEVSVPGAKEIAVHFSRFTLEKGFDRVYFMDAEGKIAGFMTGEQSGEYSPTVHGDRLTMKLVSDESTTGYGFDVDHIAFKN